MLRYVLHVVFFACFLLAQIQHVSGLGFFKFVILYPPLFRIPRNHIESSRNISVRKRKQTINNSQKEHTEILKIPKFGVNQASFD